MKNVKVEIVNTEEKIFSDYVRFIVIPCEEGEIGVLPGHASFIAKIRPGVIKIIYENKLKEFIFVAGGILEIQSNTVTVLADTAIRGKDLDEAEVKLAHQRAEEIIRNTKSNLEYSIAHAELAYAAAQLITIRHLRKNIKH